MPAATSIPHPWLHGDVDLLRAGEFDGAGVTGVGVAEDAQSWIARENAFKTALGIFSAVGDHDHAGVLRITDAYSATVVNRYPGRACSGIDQRVEQRPTGNRIAAIEHPFSLAIG